MTDEIDMRLRRPERGSVKASHTSTFIRLSGLRDGDENFDADRYGVRRKHAKAESCAV